MGIRSILKNIRRRSPLKTGVNYAKVISGLALAYTISLCPVYSQITLHETIKTDTTIRNIGDTTNITTKTIQGKNAFNSFKSFSFPNVQSVNLILPPGTDNIINLIFGSSGVRTNINGPLTSIKNGQIGGNIFLITPYDITIAGSVKTNSLTVVTPTYGFMNSIFTGPYSPDAEKVSQIINGTAPINSDTMVGISGRVHAIENVRIDTDHFHMTGEIYTDADFGPNLSTGDIVNLNSLLYIKDNDPANIVLEHGNVKIVSGYRTTIEGQIFAGNSLDISANDKKQVIIDGDVYCHSYPEYKLNIGPLGIINPLSNIDTTTTVNEVSVNDLILNTNNGGSVNIHSNNTGDVIVHGTGKVVVSGSTANVDIQNFSNKNLKVNTLSFDGDVKPGIVKINDQEITDTYGGVQILSYTGTVNIDNMTGSDVIIANEIKNETGPVRIQNRGGNILRQGDNSIIYSRDIDLIADTGSIGTSLSPVLTDLTASIIDASAKNDINITEVNGDIKVNNITSTEGDVNITTLTGSILDSGKTIEPNITGNNITLNSANDIGNYFKHFKIDSNDDTGVVNATASGSIFLNEHTGDLRIERIESLRKQDIFLSVRDGRVIDATNSDQENIIGGNLYIANPQNYYFIGINGHFDDWGIYYTFTDIYKQYGDNWAKSPDANYRLFEFPDVEVRDILDTIEKFTLNMNDNDVLMISYEGHGWGGDGTLIHDLPIHLNYSYNTDLPPLDERNGIALNVGDEFFTIADLNPLGVNLLRDDELGDAVKGAKGTIFLVTSSCFGGGMFGGDNDIDQVAVQNGFKVFGMSDNVEGRVGLGGPYTMPDGSSYVFVGEIYQLLMNTLAKESSEWETYDANGNHVTYTFENAFSPDGNVYLDHWYDVIHKGVYYDSTGFPEEFCEFTNMTSSELQETPIILCSWDPYQKAIGVKGAGETNNPLTVNLTGDLKILSDGIVNVTGNTVDIVNISGSDVKIVEPGDINLQQIQATNSVSITSINGGIFDTLPAEEANIITKDLSLFANNGVIGTNEEDIDIILTASSLNASANGLIKISSLEGDVKAGLLESTNGRVDLSVLHGGIADLNGPDNNIIANEATLFATGNINIDGANVNELIHVVSGQNIVAHNFNARNAFFNCDFDLDLKNITTQEALDTRIYASSIIDNINAKNAYLKSDTDLSLYNSIIADELFAMSYGGNVILDTVNSNKTQIRSFKNTQIARSTNNDYMDIIARENVLLNGQVNGKFDVNAGGLVDFFDFTVNGDSSVKAGSRITSNTLKTGNLNLDAGDNIYLTVSEINGNLISKDVTGFDTEKTNFKSATITTGKNVFLYQNNFDGNFNLNAEGNLTSNEIFFRNATINSGGKLIMANATIPGTLKAEASDKIDISIINSNPGVDVIKSINSDVWLENKSGSLNDSNGNEKNIIGKQALIKASEDIDLDFDVLNRTEVDCKNAHISGNTGELLVGTSQQFTGIFLNTQNASLGIGDDLNLFNSTINGSLDSLSYRGQISANQITANNVIMEAATGMIIDNARFTGNYEGYVNDGDLTVFNINTPGDVRLTAYNGNIDANLAGINARNILMRGINIQAGDDSNINAVDKVMFITELLAYETLNADDISAKTVVLSRLTPGNFVHGELNLLNLNWFITDELVIGNHESTNDLTENVIFNGPLTYMRDTLTLSAKNQILDAANDMVNIEGKNLNLISKGNIGTANNYFDIDITGTLNAEAQNGIFVREHRGELVADRINSKAASAYLNSKDSDARINYISAPDTVSVTAKGKVDIATIDPQFIYISSEIPGGSINLNNALASGSISLLADYITGKVQNTGSSVLGISAAGSNNSRANNVSLNTNSSTGVIYTSLDSNNATLSNSVSNSYMTLQNTTVSNHLSIQSDYVTATNNINFNKAGITGCNSSTASDIIISNTGNLEVNQLNTNNASISTSGAYLSLNNAIINNTATLQNNSYKVVVDNSGGMSATGADVVISTNGNFSLDLNSDAPISTTASVITASQNIDLTGAYTSPGINNDISQTSKTAEEKIDKNIHNTKNTSNRNNLTEDLSLVAFSDPELYLEDSNMNLTLYILNRAQKIYELSLVKGGNEDEALKNARIVLMQVNISENILQKLLLKDQVKNKPSLLSILKRIY